MEIKCQLNTTDVFIADLIACSTCFGHHYAHHQELKSIIQWLLPVVFRAAVFSSSWSGVELRVMCPVCRMLVYVEQAIRSAIETSVASSWHFISTGYSKVNKILLKTECRDLQTIFNSPDRVSRICCW